MADNNKKKYASLSTLQTFLNNLKSYFASKTDIDEIKVAKSDWSQNNPEAIDYIKNRTHYADKAFADFSWDGIASGETFVDTKYKYTYTKISNQVLTSADVNAATITVTSNGTAYTPTTSTISQEYTDMYYCNKAFNIGGKYIYVFIITGKAGAYDLCTIPSDGTYVKVYMSYAIDWSELKFAAAGTVVQIDEMFIPDSIARVEDVNANMNKFNIALSGKADSSHSHDDLYYTEDEINSKLAEKSDTTHNHDNDYDTKGAAAEALNSAKIYADGVKNDLLNGASGAYDTLKELGDLIDDNTDAIGALEIVAIGKADKEHTHTVSDITDLTATATELNYMGGVTSNVQEQLDGKADSSHTHSNASLGQGHGDCYTATSTTEKAVDIYRYKAVNGGVVSVKFIYSVPASATMNINSEGAKPIYYRDSAIIDNIIKGGDTATFIYDGSRYHLISIDRWHEDIVDLQETDGKVRQVLATANSNYPLLLTPNFQTETTTAQTYFDSGVYLNPYYNKIYGVDIDGNAGSASKLSVDAGSVNQPVYFADGVPVAATGIYSKADHEWTLIYDSGEIPDIANSISGIDVSGYTNFEVLVRCYNDGDSHTTRTGSAIFKAQNGKSYQFPVWTNMFTKSISTASVMAQFKLVDGWLVCPYASKLTGDIDIFNSTEGGTAGNLTPTGSGMMKCTSPLSTLTISNLDQNSDYYFGMGSRVMVWGWNA